MIQLVDSSILHEIARVVSTRSKVPDRVRVRGKEYQLTYLDDHKQRIEDALRRHDPDRLSMLYGQMASKVKYQLLRQTTARRASRSRARGAGAGEKRTSTRGTPGQLSRAARPGKERDGTSKRKSEAGKKRGAPTKKPALGTKRTVPGAARR